MNIRTENLSKRFNHEWIFRNLTFEFSSGNIYAITGPNGSGKSTLLSVLSGHVPPTSGSLLFGDKSRIDSEDIFRHLTYAAPYMDLIEEFTLEEQLQFHSKMRKLRKDTSIDDLINILYLERSRDKYIGNFSSGMKQRLKLGLAFFTQSSIIILDEPCSNLDKQAISWYHGLLKSIPPDTLVLIGSNDPQEYPEHAINLNVMDFKR